jgi:ATP-dependent helicase/DNAse subunit B
MGVPLTLVTGPANAEKARVVLDGYRAAADEAPLLVVPTYADVVRYRRELADDGLVFGTAIVRFRQLTSEMARRGGVRGRGLSRLQRERVAAAAIAAAPLDVLRRSAATAGFPAALVRLASELEQGRVDPARFTSALRAWAAGTSRADYAEELAALYSGYRRVLEATGRTDDDLRLAAAVDALREDPGRWGARPVFVYGFDDLRPLQREAIAVLAATGAEVTVSLTFEAGRYAFAGRTETVEALRPVADRVVELPAIPDHYASPALHHLERRLFEPPEDGALFDAAAPELDPAKPAITLMEGGGERAELELVAAEVARLIREDGVAPEEIAIVARDVAAIAPSLRRVFGAAGVPIALERRAVFGHTPLGAGLVALLRCALLDGTAEDLLTWLRTPGLLHEPALADRLEARARQEGARTAAVARELWERERWPLDAIDRVAAAHDRGPRALM